MASGGAVRAASVGAVLFIHSCGGVATAQPTIVDLFPGGARGVSADGSVVVGGAGPDSYRWSSTGGAVLLPCVPGGPLTIAWGVTGAADAIVGWIEDADGNSQAARWASPGAPPVLLAPIPPRNAHAAYAISGDGRAVVGESYLSGVFTGSAVRWTPAGVQNLGVLSGGTFASAAGVNFDGTAVVGWSSSIFGDRPFRWTPGLGMRNLGTLPSDDGGYAQAVNQDGRIVVGFGSSGGLSGAWRWTATNGAGSTGTLQSLGSLPGHEMAYAVGCSADGGTIVGYNVDLDAPPGADFTAVVWTADGAAQDLNAWAAARGADVTGWRLEVAVAVSADGTTIVGSGVRGGEPRAFAIRGLSGLSALSVSGPAGAGPCPGGPAELTVATAGPGPRSYRWAVARSTDADAPFADLTDGPLVVDGVPWGTVQGSAGATLRVTPDASGYKVAPSLRFRAVVSSPGRSVTSGPGTLAVCAADYTCADGVDLLDIFAFLGDWFSGAPRADFDGRNGVDLLDIFGFLAAWFAGC